MKRLFLVLLVAAPFHQALAQTDDFPPLSTVIDSQFADDDHWFDGKAEVAVYDASRVFYGKSRDYTSTLITVTEDFNREYYVKADYPYGNKPLLPVVKQNRIEIIETDNYPYHFMTSVFVELKDFAHAVKLSTSSQDWCGITTKDFELWKAPAIQKYMSYWDGEGSGERRLGDQNEAYFEEELTLILRGLNFEDGRTASFFLYDNQITNRAGEAQVHAANLTIGELEEGWDVSVRTKDGRSIQYRFALNYPHELLSMDHSDGRSMKLVEIERRAYWQ